MSSQKTLSPPKIFRAHLPQRLMLERRMMPTSETGSQRNSSSPLQLWYAWPSDLAGPAVEQACLALLDEAERARAARFHFDRHRREYVATHALTRAALSHARPLPPREWSYSVNAYGKPAPVPECGVCFSQSHSLELVVCLLADVTTNLTAPGAHLAPGANVEARPDPSPKAGAEGSLEVGVDLEAFSRAPEILPLAPRVFSAAERAQLDALPAADRPGRALSLWTLKEAYIKARGMGLSLPLSGISFLFGPAGEIHLETGASVDANPTRWRFCLVDHSRHRIALAVDRVILNHVTRNRANQNRPSLAQPTGSIALTPQNPRAPIPPFLEIFSARPPFAAPTRLPPGSETWFSTLPAASQSHSMG